MKALENLSIILVRPKYAENVGSAARAALNMGISRLCIVGAATIDLDAARKTATHNARHLLDNVRFAEHISDITAEFSLLVGTSARLGRSRRPTSLPDQLAEPLLPYIQSGTVGLLFGPESSGLTNEELKHCGLLTTIPTAEFSSLNLAQSVIILCYELRKGVLAAMAKSPNLRRPQPANEHELAAMYNEATRLLNSLEMPTGKGGPDMLLKHMHQLLGRACVNSKEAKLIKDTCGHLYTALNKIEKVPN